MGTFVHMLVFFVEINLEYWCDVFKFAINLNVLSIYNKPK